MVNDEFELYDLEVYVRGNKKDFVCSHSVGLAFEVIGENIVFSQPGFSFSQYALGALLPLLPVKQRPTAENDWVSTDNIIACPDVNCKATFEIVRKKKHVFRHSDVTVTALGSNG